MCTVQQNVILKGIGSKDHQLRIITKMRDLGVNVAIVCLGVMCLASTTLAGQILYIDGNGTGPGDGSTWLNAYRFLQDALVQAEPGDEIWVATGVYCPDQTASSPDGNRDRNSTFQLKNGIAVYGGFPLGGGPWNARDVSSYPTILSGDLAGNDGPDFTDNGENSYHVLTGSGTDASAILDGFTVTAGNANHSWRNESPFHFGTHWGGGMINSFGSPTLVHCAFVANTSSVGGALANYGGSPRIHDCLFIDNLAKTSETGLGGIGGAIYNCEGSHPDLLSCQFVGNFADIRGGAVRNYEGSNPTFEECGFYSNYAGDTGGGVHNYQSSPVFSNCVFRENEAQTQGGGLLNQNQSNVILEHCTFQDNCSGSKGGAMTNNNSAPVFNKCNFIGNETSEFGGAMWNENQSNLSLRNCSFTCNYAGIQGGAVFNMRSRPDIIDCRFLMNSCGDSSYGGAIYNLWNSDTVMTRCRFSGNTAQRGGAVFSYQSSPTLLNCILEGNRASWGGAFYTYNHNVNSNSHTTINNCTFAGNTALDGSAIGCDSTQGLYPSQLSIAGCIFRDSGNEVANADDSTIIITYSNIQGGWRGTGNFDADPLFAKLGYWCNPQQTPHDKSDDIWVEGDYHLRSQAGRYAEDAQAWVRDDLTSPCIDAGRLGSALGLEPSPNGGIVNLGAYAGTAEASKSFFLTKARERRSSVR